MNLDTTIRDRQKQLARDTIDRVLNMQKAVDLKLKQAEDHLMDLHENEGSIACLKAFLVARFKRQGYVQGLEDFPPNEDSETCLNFGTASSSNKVYITTSATSPNTPPSQRVFSVEGCDVHLPKEEIWVRVWAWFQQELESSK